MNEESLEQNAKRQSISGDQQEPASNPTPSPQIIVFISKLQPGSDPVVTEDKATYQKISALPYDCIEQFYTELKETKAEEGEDDFMSFEEFAGGLAELPRNLYINDDLQMIIHHITVFENVPAGRHVTEIVNSIYYTCASNRLLHKDDCLEIKCSKNILDVLINPNECINPYNFDWNIPYLTKRLKNTLSLSAWMDCLD